MDVCTEQAYQRCIAELTHQLAERDARIVDLRAQVADMSVKVAVLTQQATALLAPSGPAVQELLEFLQAAIP